MSTNRTYGSDRCLAVTYHGSLVEFHGDTQLVGDCECADCIQLDPWEPARRAELRLPDGRRLTHVRRDSFTCAD